MSPPLFLVDALPAGERLVLDGPEGRHAAVVKRLRADEEVLVADGRGGVVRARVTAVGRAGVDLTVVARRVVDPPVPRVLLAQALVKGDRGELAVELATEAGVDGILPWRAARCVARWDDGPRGARALERWRSTVREAAKQARRPWLPTVTEPMSTAQLAERIRRDGGGLVLHEGASELLTGITLPVGDLLLVVGPEGGVADAGQGDDDRWDVQRVDDGERQMRLADTGPTRQRQQPDAVGGEQISEHRHVVRPAEGRAYAPDHTRNVVVTEERHQGR